MTIRIMSGYFLLLAIFTVIFLFSSKTAPVLFLIFSVIWLVLLISVSIGLWKLQPWSRYAAIVAFLLKAVQFELSVIRDIKTMSSHYVDKTGILFAVLIMVPFTALYIAAIWWLSRPSTKEIFIHKIT
jgi:hypothetical protein